MMRVTPFEYFSVAIAIVTVLLIPLVVLLIRGAVKWTRVEGKLDGAIVKLGEIVQSKDRDHAELAAQMREDRKATDERLRRLEDHVWPRRRKRRTALPRRDRGDSV